MSGVVYVDQSIPDSPQNTPSGKTTIKTDFSSYKKGNMIKISGIIPYHDGWKHNTVQLIIQIFDPRNNLVTVSQFFPNEDRTYSASINSRSPMWKFEGDYIIRTSYALEQASTKFLLTHPGNTFNPQSPAPSTQSKTSTLLILDSIPSTFEAQGQNSQAEVIISGKLTSSDRQYVITSAIIQLKAERWGTVITTDGNGEFSFKKNWDVGNNYGVYAYFGGTTEFLSSKSQTEYFDVKLSSQPFIPPSDDTPYAGIAGLLIVVVVIAGIVIGIKGAKKKKQTPYQTIGGSVPQPPQPAPAPPKQKATWRRKPKPQIQPQGIEDYDLGPLLYCPNVACRSEHLQTKANGEKYCTKCGWNK